MMVIVSENAWTRISAISPIFNILRKHACGLLMQHMHLFSGYLIYKKNVWVMVVRLANFVKNSKNSESVKNDFLTLWLSSSIQWLQRRC